MKFGVRVGVGGNLSPVLRGKAVGSDPEGVSPHGLGMGSTSLGAFAAFQESHLKSGAPEGPPRVQICTQQYFMGISWNP